jgi:hypothetical protein
MAPNVAGTDVAKGTASPSEQARKVQEALAELDRARDGYNGRVERSRDQMTK